MALTPKEALGNKPENLKRQLRDLEKRVDERLAEEFDGRKAVAVYVDLGTDSWVQDQLARLYEDRGWQVERRRVEADRPGESDSLQFVFRAQVAV